MQLFIDDMDDASQWSPLGPDGTTPSTEISITTDTAKFRYGEDNASARITATENARNHRLRRSMPAMDLSRFDELRFWFWSTRVADDSSTRPFFLRLRLGSAAMALNNPGNIWFRYLPAFRAEVWELVRVTIADLAPQIRSALNAIELTCVDGTPIECNLDTLLATREEMLNDVEVALAAKLHQRINVGGAAVIAHIHNPDDPAPVVMPNIRIIPRPIFLSTERAGSGESRTDFTDNAFRLRPIGIPYNLYYDIDVFAENRQHKAEIYDFVLKTLAPRNELIVNGQPVTVELVNALTEPIASQNLSERTLLRFKVSAWQPAGTSIPVRPPYREVIIEADSRAPA